jgi:hypothetical protein
VAARHHMQANAAIYLPSDRVDLRDVFPEAMLAGGLFRKKSAFRIPFKKHTVLFNVMPVGQVETHISQFLGYIDSLDESEEARDTTRRVVRSARTVLGLETGVEFEGNEELGDILVKIAEHYKGFLFIFDSVVLHDGEVLVGPLKEAAT